MKGIRRRMRGPTRRTRIGAWFAVVAVVAFAQISASAQLELPQLPLPTSSPLPTEPLDLEDLLNLDELLIPDLPVETDVDDVVDGVTGTVSDVLGGPSDDESDALGGKQKPAPAILPPADSQTGSWSIDRLLPNGSIDPARVSSSRLPAPSYGAAVGSGFARAARRAAQLAGPVAAPMILALFAVGLLFVAARGPGRLVKVEEERKAFNERRTFRL